MKGGNANAIGISFHLGDKITVLGDFTLDSGALLLSDLSTPATSSLDIYGDLTVNCANLVTWDCSRAYNSGVTVYGIMATLKGNNKNITQATGAHFGFQKLEIDLVDNTQYVTLQSDMDAQKQAPLTGAWGDVLLKTGNLDLNGYSFTDVSNLDVTAGFACSAPLVYSTSSGVTGSGCGP